MTLMSRIVRIVCLMMMVGLVAPAATPGTIRADDESYEGAISVKPAKAAPGDTVRVSGVDLPPDSDGELIWADLDEEIKDVETDGDGTFATEFVVPDLEPGEYRLAVEIEDADASAKLVILADESATAVPPTEEAPAPEPTDPPEEETTPDSEDEDSNSDDEDNQTPTTEATSKPDDPTPTKEDGANSAAAGSEIWIATNGSDSGDGSSGKPFRTLQKALDVVAAGQTINLKAGTYTAKDTVLSKRNGSSGKPIVIQSAPGGTAVLTGPASARGLQIEHNWYIIRNLEFSNADILLWLDGASNVVITGNLFHDAGGECVRIKNQSTNNTFSNNVVRDCGREGFNLSAGSKNGEGVYIGTAPEQRSKIGGVPDKSTGNIIENNTFATNGSEGVDLKEDAEYNIVRNNVAYGNRDPEGANFGTRGDNNTFTSNESYNSAGAGFRAGGDTVDGRVYGKNNVFRSNYSHDNKAHSFKFMVGPQDVDCTNVSAANGGEEYYFGTSEFTIACDGDPGTEPTKEPTRKPTQEATPKPTKTPTPKPTSWTSVAIADSQAASHNPKQTYGNSKTFRVDNLPGTVAYLKFKVSGIDADNLEKVTLRIYVLDPGGSSVQLYSVGSTSWAEGGVSWGSRPKLGKQIGSVDAGPSVDGVWLEFDVTSIVNRGGTFSFALVTTSNDGYSFYSSEAASRRPHLLIKTD